MIGFTKKNLALPAVKQKRCFLWVLIISLAVGWMSTACETAPKSPAAGDTAPSAETTAACTTVPADTPDLSELTPEQIRTEILKWEGVADFQDDTIYTTFTQVSERVQIKDMMDQIQKWNLGEKIRHIKVGEAVLDVSYIYVEQYARSAFEKYCITAVTAHGQTVSFEHSPLDLWYPNQFYIVNTEDVTIIGHGTYHGNWWFISDNGYVTDLRESRYDYSREGYVYYYYYDDNNTLCYLRQPKKFMYTQDAGMILDVCVSPDELYRESGTVNFDADGKPVYTVVSTETVGMDHLEKAFSTLKNGKYQTLDEYLAHNAAIYECVK